MTAVTWAQFEHDVFEADTANAARKGWENGKIALKVKAGKTPTAVAVKGTLSVIPAANKYSAGAWEAWTEDQNQDTDTPTTTADDTKASWADIAKTASEVKNVSVAVKKADATGKISVDNKKKTLKAEDFTPDQTTGNFVATVPYSVKIVAKVSKVEAAKDKNNKLLAPEWMSFGKEDATDAITITIDKAKYAEAVRKDSTLNGKKQSNVKVNVTFAATGSKAEQISFTITPPTLGAEDLADDAVKSINITTPGNSAKLAPGETLNCVATVEGNSGVTLTDDQKKVVWSIETENIKSGTTITEAGKLTIAADEEVTKITVKATSAVNSKVSATAEVTIEKNTESENPTA